VRKFQNPKSSYGSPQEHWKNLGVANIDEFDKTLDEFDKMTKYFGTLPQTGWAK